MIIPENVQPYIRKMQHYGPGLLTNTTYERLNPTGTWKIVYPASSDESLVEPALYLQHEYTKIMLWLFPIKMKHYRWIHEDDIVFRTERREEIFRCHE